MRPQPTRQFVGAVALAITVSLGPLACDSNNTATGPEGSPRLTVLFGGANALPTASGDAVLFGPDGTPPTEVWIRVEDICLQGVGDGDHEGDQNGRQCLLDTPTDWIAIAGPSAEWIELVEGVEVPPGAHQLRFILMDVVILLDLDGSIDAYATSDDALADLNDELGQAYTKTGQAHCPSCTRSGLKVAFPGGDPDMQDGDNIFMAEFDVSESFGRLRGNSGRWVMHPLIRGSLAFRPGSIGGTISVATDATFDDDALPGSCGGQEVNEAALIEYLEPTVSDGTTETVATDRLNGSYVISPLPAPATYTLGWTFSVPYGSASIEFSGVTVTDSDDPADDKSIELLAGQAATADYQITAASCGT